MICLEFAPRKLFYLANRQTKLGKACKLAKGVKSTWSRSLSTIAYENSPVQTIEIGAHHRVHVKRDDLLGEPGTGGNKARKLAHFRRLLDDPVVSSSYQGVISTGGGQSNAMLATAHFAKEHGLQFDYFSRPLSKDARSEAQGNLAVALSLGMHLHECQDVNVGLEEYVLILSSPLTPKTQNFNNSVLLASAFDLATI